MPDASLSPDISLAFQERFPSWRTALPQAEECFTEALCAVVAERIKGLRSGEVCVVLTGDADIQSLNRTWRGKDAPTNVLSFPAEEEAAFGDEPVDLDPFDEDPVLGDIVLALETITREANEQSKTLADHATHLFVHGFLHLLGYDHQEDEEAGQMEALERKILGRLNIEDPYRLRETAKGETD